MSRGAVILVISVLALMAGVTAAMAAAAPVDFQFKGVNQAKNATEYSIKILTEKPVTQVDFQLKFFDKGGQVLMDTPNIWQNIVKSVRQPIEGGKTYEVEDFLKEGAVRAEARLLRVWFKDGTRWEAPK